MKFRDILIRFLLGTVFLGTPLSALAVSAVTTINVTVTRYLSITNTSTLEFGSVATSATAGTVVVDIDGISQEEIILLKGAINYDSWKNKFKKQY